MKNEDRLQFQLYGTSRKKRLDRTREAAARG